MQQQETKQRPTASEKACTKCGETKPLTEFFRQKRGKFGRRSMCKACVSARDNANNRERNRRRYQNDPEYRDRAMESNRTNYRKRREDPEKLAHDRERQRLYFQERYRSDPEYRERYRAAQRERYQTDPRCRERQHRYNQEQLAKRSSRVRRIRKLLDHFEGRDAYLNHIAHAIDSRSDAQGLQWLCSRIDTLVAERVYGEL